MSRVSYYNPLSHGVYVGTVFVPARTARTVDASLLPQAAASEPAEPPSANAALEELAALAAKKVIEAIPGLDAAQLDALLAIEREDKKRTTVIEAIESRRVELLTQGEQAETQALVESLPTLDKEQLDALLEQEVAGKNRQPIIDAIELRKLELEDEAALTGNGGSGDGDSAGQG